MPDKSDYHTANDQAETAIDDLENHAGRLEAASLLWRILYSVDNLSDRAGLESGLAGSQHVRDRAVRDMQRAERDIVLFDRGVALRTSLDAVLPGWFDVDVSDDLPERLWHVHIDNSVTGWVSWLVAQGMEHDQAMQLVMAQAPDEAKERYYADCKREIDEGGYV